MPYTTQGYMTAGDMAEIRRDMDLDLCGCCESGAEPNRDADGLCLDCECEH